MENTSGQGAAAAVPAEVDRWNWGAFLLNWIWGIGNNTFIAFLMFVPLVNAVMPFVLGVKGSAWAWRNKRWESIEHFQRVQRQWAMWGAIVATCIVLAVGSLFFAVVKGLKSSEAYRLAVAELENNRAANLFIGKPMTTGMALGEIKVSGPGGVAELSFSVEGPNGSGTVYLEATKNMGEWQLDRMLLEEAGTGRRIPLIE